MPARRDIASCRWATTAATCGASTPTGACCRPTRGVYVECESISLTRDIPFGLSWIVKPFVTSLPKDSLTFTLETTRKALMKRER